ncbi:MAG: DMT family transporter [Elusimicrobia bacterium]|nr:DMT family transporter [Elusimicrobiota bacterium]
MKGRGLSAAGLAFCTLVWGASFIFIKDALSHAHPLALVGWRFSLAALAMLAVPSVRKNLSGCLRQGAVLGFWLTLVCVTQTWGLAYTSASSSGFITGLFVLFVPLILRLAFRQALGLFNDMCVLLALAGLWVMTGGPSGFNRGDALTLFAAFGSAAHIIMAGRYTQECPDVAMLAFHQFWITGLFCFALGAAIGAPLGVASAAGWGAVLFLTLLPTLGAFFIQLWGQKRVPPMQASLIFSLEPVFAALFAWTLGGEKATSAKLLGGAMMLAAAIGSELWRLRPAAWRPKPT